MFWRNIRMKKNMNSAQTKIRRNLVLKGKRKGFNQHEYNKKRYAKIKAFREQWGWSNG